MLPAVALAEPRCTGWGRSRNRWRMLGSRYLSSCSSNRVRTGHRSSGHTAPRAGSRSSDPCVHDEDVTSMGSHAMLVRYWSAGFTGGKEEGLPRAQIELPPLRDDWSGGHRIAVDLNSKVSCDLLQLVGGHHALVHAVEGEQVCLFGLQKVPLVTHTPGGERSRRSHGHRSSRASLASAWCCWRARQKDSGLRCKPQPHPPVPRPGSRRSQGTDCVP